MVKPGYKQTEIGILPDAWDTITFEDCFTILPNNTLSRVELNYNSGEVQNIHYGDILIKFPAVLDCSAEGLPYINAENTTKASKGFLRDGDLIMADTAEDVIVGKSTEVIGVGERKIVSGLHTIPCRPKDAEMFALGWLGYFINHSTYHDQLIPYITGIKVSSISKSAISGTVIAVPKKEEQTEITAALSDIDTLITNLEKLVVKKKAIKQGAMQELLTGKRRLPGFDGEWEIGRIGAFGEFISGSCFPLIHQGKQRGRYPFYKVSDFNNPGNERRLNQANNYVSQETADYLGCKIIPEKAIVIAKIGAAIFLERKKITTVSCCIDNNMMAFVPFAAESAQFICYVFQGMRLGDLVEATALPSLSGKTICSIEMQFPPTKEEQMAIAAVLADMDSEIEELEKKLSKYRKIKSGMMSELLTGRIRLL